MKWTNSYRSFGLKTKRSTGLKTIEHKHRNPGNAAAEGFFGRMKVEAVHPEKREERPRGEALVLIDEYIHWYNHERIKQSLGWMSPVQYRQSQGTAA